MGALRVVTATFAWALLGLGAGRAAWDRTPHLDPGVTRVGDAFVAAVLKGDASAVARLYLEDGVELPDCAPRAAGRSAVEAYFRHLFEGPGRITAFTLDPLEARVEGDLAYTTGASRMTISRGPSLPPLEIPGKYLVLLRRAGAEWKVAYAIYNGDKPPSAP